MFRTVVSKLSILAMLGVLGATNYAACPPGGDCNCGPTFSTIECYVGDMGGLGTVTAICQTLICECKSITGVPVVTQGKVGTPVCIMSGNAPACNAPQGNGPNDITYSSTSGWSIEICVGAQVQLGTGSLPGANWTLDVKGCWKYDTQKTSTAKADVSSPGCQWWNKDVIETPIAQEVSVPMSNSTYVTMTNCSVFTDCCSTFGHAAGESWSYSSTCSTSTKTGTGTLYSYSFQLENWTSKCTTTCVPTTCPK